MVLCGEMGSGQIRKRKPFVRNREQDVFVIEMD